MVPLPPQTNRKRASPGAEPSPGPSNAGPTCVPAVTPPAALKGNTAYDPVKEKWIGRLLASEFFVPCHRHSATRKNECTYFCIECNSGDTHCPSLCRRCMEEDHDRSHNVIQIRRYVYHNVTRVCDIQGYVDVASVQAYIINGSRVVFLNPRPQSKFTKSGLTERCRTCARFLRDGFHFCSLACKLRSLPEYARLRETAPEGTCAAIGAASTSTDSKSGMPSPRSPRSPRSGPTHAPDSMAGPAPARVGGLDDLPCPTKLLPPIKVPRVATGVSPGAAGRGGSRGGGLVKREVSGMSKDASSDSDTTTTELCSTPSSRRKQATPRRAAFQ